MVKSGARSGEIHRSGGDCGVKPVLEFGIILLLLLELVTMLVGLGRPRLLR
jgi:hypothetical protein